MLVSSSGVTVMARATWPALSTKLLMLDGVVL